MVLAVAAIAWFVPEWPQGLLVMLPALLVGVVAKACGLAARTAVEITIGQGAELGPGSRIEARWLWPW